MAKSRQASGKFDRHVWVQLVSATTDAAGDEVFVASNLWQRWMEKRERGAFREVVAKTEVLRDADVVFVTRADDRSREIYPETHRLYYKSRVYEIVGLGESNERDDCIILLCCYRPDGRGSRGPGRVSQP